MSEKYQTVSKVVNYLKSVIDDDVNLNNIIVQGEISNFKNHSSGHWYFTLKDANSRINCVMWRSYAVNMKYTPQDGDKVLVRCSASIYEASGSLQLYCTNLKLDGEGDLLLKLEKLKKKLSEEGYFDVDHKKELPLYPLNIGLVTGENAAGKIDTINTIKRRWPIANIIENNCLVQGNEASKDIIRALKEIDNKVDVILLVRGGGSIEDLWCFNDENLVKTIYELNTPLVSGVGHDIDFTLADFVADVRAITPTAAAELATPDYNDILSELANTQKQLLTNITHKVENASKQLETIKKHRIISNPINLYQDKIVYIDTIKTKLDNNVTNKMLSTKMQFETIKTGLVNEMDKYKINLSNKLDNIANHLNSNVSNRIDTTKGLLNQNKKLLYAYSPNELLKKGYSITYKNNKVVKSIQDLKIDDEIETVLKDGKVISQIKEK